MTDDQFAALLAEVRAIRRAIERQPVTFDRHAELLAALRDYFGIGAPFTANGILAVCDDDPHDSLSIAVARAINLDAPGRAVALGKLLSSIDALERSPRGGILLYRLPEWEG